MGAVCSTGPGTGPVQQQKVPQHLKNRSTNIANARAGQAMVNEGATPPSNKTESDAPAALAPKVTKAAATKEVMSSMAWATDQVENEDEEAFTLESDESDADSADEFDGAEQCAESNITASNNSRRARTSEAVGDKPMAATADTLADAPQEQGWNFKRWQENDLPQHMQKANGSAPDVEPKLDWVYGYRGDDVRNNIFIDSEGRLVFYTATVGIIYDVKNHTQTHLLGHTNDIICMAMHPNKSIIATSQIGKDPCIRLWDTTGKTLAVLEGSHERGINTLAFSQDGDLLMSVGVGDRHMVAVWDWTSEELLASARGHTDSMYTAQHLGGDTWTTAGNKICKVWTFNRNNGTLTAKKGLFGRAAKIQPLLGSVRNANGDFVTVGFSGDIYLWSDRRVVRAIKGHSGAVYAVARVDDTTIATGGKDGFVRFWKDDLSTDQCLAEVRVGTILRAIVATGNNWEVYCGTKTGQILHIPDSMEDAYEAEDNVTTTVYSHGTGELWGLCVSAADGLVVTASEDGYVRVWDPTAKCHVRHSEHLKVPLASCELSPTDDVLLVTSTKGDVIVLTYSTLEVIKQLKHRQTSYEDVKFAPDGTMVALASHEMAIDIFDTKTWERTKVLKGHSATVTHIDWSTDATMIQSNSADYELMYWNVSTGARLEERAASVLEAEWATFTCIIGWHVRGIYERFADGTAVNGAQLCPGLPVIEKTEAADGSKAAAPKEDTTDAVSSAAQDDEEVAAEPMDRQRLFATAEDSSKVKLFRWPVTKAHADYTSAQVHAAFVTNVRWAHDSSMFFTTGGRDQTVCQWKLGVVEV